MSERKEKATKNAPRRMRARTEAVRARRASKRDRFAIPHPPRTPADWRQLEALERAAHAWAEAATVHDAAAGSEAARRSEEETARRGEIRQDIAAVGLAAQAIDAEALLWKLEVFEREGGFDDDDGRRYWALIVSDVQRLATPLPKSVNQPPQKGSTLPGGCWSRFMAEERAAWAAANDPTLSDVDRDSRAATHAALLRVGFAAPAESVEALAWKFEALLRDDSMHKCDEVIAGLPLLRDDALRLAFPSALAPASDCPVATIGAELAAVMDAHHNADVLECASRKVGDIAGENLHEREGRLLDARVHHLEDALMQPQALSATGALWQVALVAVLAEDIAACADPCDAEDVERSPRAARRAREADRKNAMIELACYSLAHFLAGIGADWSQIEPHLPRAYDPRTELARAVLRVQARDANGAEAP